MKNTSSLSIILPSLLALLTAPFASTALPAGVNSTIAMTPTTPGEARDSGIASEARAGPGAGIPPSRDVATKLGGLFPEGSGSVYELDDFAWFTEPGASLASKLKGGIEFVFRGGLAAYVRYIWMIYGKKGKITTLYDARAQEAAEGLSKAEFFEKYGFVILDAPTAMTASDWEASDRDLTATLKEFTSRDKDGGERYKRRLDEFRNADTPVQRIYARETEELIRSVLPRAKTIMPPSQGIRRKVNGGGLQKSPAALVHNDYGLDFDEVVNRNPFFDFDKQRAIYEASDSDEYMLVNLWRPIAPMSPEQPLRSMPLCFLDSSTLQDDDFMSLDNRSFGVLTLLKRNPNHRFYYYPDMSLNEVVLFKQFHKHRNESIARMPVFHSAFADPAADETTEDRVSFEYRVGLLA